jgi:hypothetical protein
MMKLEGSNCLQFPFELASPTFSDGPELQDNIFDSLRHQVVEGKAIPVTGCGGP